MDDSLSDGFRAVARRMREAAREALAPWDVTPAQARALGTLLRAGPLRLGDLADALRIAPRSATEVVDLLERQELVERVPDPSDRRATLVALTPRGAALREQVREDRRRESDEYFSRLDPQDRIELERLLRLLTADGSGPG